MVPWFVSSILVLSVVLPFLPGGNAGFPYFYINNSRVSNNTRQTLPQGRAITLSCQYDQISSPDTKFFEVTPAGPTLISSSYSGQSRLFVTHTVPISEATGQHTYRCKSTNNVFVQVTITFYGGPPPATTRPPTTTMARSTHSTHVTVGGGGSHSDQFTGLNPLIYTISAVILLGTLAIVAIITCWIRARRSFNSRSLRSNNTPQDYLDYISDNEFTPMTTSEFLASLQERPPTYNESEQIQSRITQEGDGERSDNPPPNSEQRQGRETGGSGEDTNTEASGSSAAGPSSGSEARSSRRDASGDATMQASGRDLPVVGDLLGVDLDVPVQLEAAPQQPVDILTPTQEQISEIEATVGAVNERMRQIRQRERELNLRLQDNNREGNAVTGTLDTEDIFLFDRPV